MVGNDIVDIARAKNDSNWKRPRFLDKLFTKQEQQIIHNSKNPFLMVWRFWSMKEAAYKLYTQGSPSRFYSPKGFQCCIEERFGTVKFKNFRCYVETKITSNYILSEASIQKAKMNSEVFTFSLKQINKQSQILKNRVLQSFSKRYGISLDKLAFKKDEYGIPTIKTSEYEIPISLTHHGRFGAFVFSHNSCKV